MAGLNKNLESANTAYDKYLKDHPELKEISKLQDEVAAKEAKLNAAEKEFKSTETEVSSKSAEIEKLKNSMENLKVELEKATKERDQLTAETKPIIKDLNVLRAELATEKSKLEKIKDSEATIKKEILESNEGIKKLESDIKTDETDFDRANKAIDNFISTIKVDQNGKTLKDIKDDLLNKENLLKNAEINAKKALENLKSTEDALSAAKAKLADLEKTPIVSLLDKSTYADNKALNDLVAKKDNAAQEVEKLDKLIQTLKTDVFVSEYEVDKAFAKYQKAKKDLEKAQAEYDRLRSRGKTTSKGSVKTGDSQDLEGFGSLSLMASALVASTLIRRKKSEE